MEKIISIHYACSDLNGGSLSCVTAISLYEIETQKSVSFSIAEAKERLGMDVSEAILERDVLERFFDFAHTYENSLWIHWHMSSSLYGFEALVERYGVLSGVYFDITFRLINLPDRLYTRYQKRCMIYPKMVSFLDKNEFDTTLILYGEEEAKAYQKGDFDAIKISSLLKAKAFGEIFSVTLLDHKWRTPCSLNYSRLIWIALCVIGSIVAILYFKIGN